MNYTPVVESLELLAARDIDPTEAVYRRLFARHPEMEALFIRDTKHIVRGQMVQMVMENLLDYATVRGYRAGDNPAPLSQAAMKVTPLARTAA